MERHYIPAGAFRALVKGAEASSSNVLVVRYQEGATKAGRLMVESVLFTDLQTQVIREYCPGRPNHSYPNERCVGRDQRCPVCGENRISCLEFCRNDVVLCHTCGEHYTDTGSCDPERGWVSRQWVCPGCGEKMYGAQGISVIDDRRLHCARCGESYSTQRF